MIIKGDITIDLPNPWERAKPEVEKNVHGWFSKNKMVVIDRLLKEYELRIIVEVGSWMGQSALFFAERSEFVICIDTWLGNDHFFYEESLRKFLPVAYETFLVNCWEMQHKILPFRVDSKVGLWYLSTQDVEVDMVYIDGSHYYEDVKEDIKCALKLKGNPLLVGDDFSKRFANDKRKEVEFPVKKATREIFGDKVENEGTTWWVKA